MFTSRAEYRLLLREDNADLRLTELGRQIGLVGDLEYKRFSRKKDYIRMEKARMEQTWVTLSDEQRGRLKAEGGILPEKTITLATLLRCPGVNPKSVREMFPPDPDVPESATEEAEIQIKYSGYVEKQEKQIKRLARLENLHIPEDFDFSSLPSLSRELKEKLSKIRPRTLGQASRIPGMTPAAIGVLDVFISRRR
jgi:tRNA uridine 5-carboxymethylaminomethyl modification enzyme